jgi:hypothetical protein
MVSQNTFEAAVNSIKSDPAVAPGTVFPSYPEGLIRATVNTTAFDNSLALTVANDAGENVELDHVDASQAVFRVTE